MRASHDPLAGETDASAVTLSDDPGQRLSYQQTVPRHLVHRAAVSEVFLTDARPSGDDRFLVAAQWPRDHALYYPDGEGHADPLLFAETIRQAMVYLTHAYYGVPFTHCFVGSDFDFEITDPELLRVGATPLQPVLHARWTDLGSQPPRRTSLRVDVELSIGGRPCGRGSISVIALDPKRYRVLRHRGAGAAVEAGAEDGARPASRLPAARVGRLRGRDCVLERTESGAWQMRAALDHAVLFDHPTDHIPLMVLLEGFRQLGHVLMREPASVGRPEGPLPVLTGVQVSCVAFAELYAPVEFQVQDGFGRPGELRVDAVQAGRRVATATMTWALPGTADQRVEPRVDDLVAEQRVLVPEAVVV
ncbi:A-factor biosynthesis hotdog protein [Streptomyces sp. 1114.5]|uniref:ScbA/BarX family gamma-butyrolactone biosynthesis protein n=1 Tax=Streptomyces sp. 1114.5 TaxID=1938830 RepID=UPI000EB31749|nr:ScbA/BarX family gamma-butyrolactone biosynthesis protein [Streptomyces sp. 1114.5]RKT11399.1 A-factor biosynthesis hotdog protein [Streptomyces sp. 1114.5]